MRWVQMFQETPGARLLLLCFTYAGGPTRLYRDWGAELGPEVDVGAVVLPGKERRFDEAPYSRMDALVPALTEGLLAALDRPFALFGHSMGALVAYELATRLRDLGHRGPARLFVSGRPAPEHVSPLPPLHELPDDRFIAEVQRRYGGIPPQVLRERELVALMIPALRADLTLVETYVDRPRAPLGCPIDALTGAADPLATAAQMACWARRSSAGFTQRVFPGDHFFVQGAPGLLAHLRARIFEDR